MIKLDQPYSLGLFQDILESLFGDKGNIFDASKVVNQKGYWKYITRMDRIGEQSDLEVQFYVVEHRGLSDPRVSLTKEIFRTLSDAGHRRALVAIYHPDSPIWRVSLVTMTLDISESGKLTREYSNARRYSFLLGLSQVYTPTKQLLSLGNINSFDDLKNRFSIEVVNRDFYFGIAEFFYELTGGTIIKGKNKIIKEPVIFYPLVTNERARKEFGVRLFGRIMFCWFLKQKLLDDGNGLIPSTLLSSSVVGGGRYYNDILEPLFFQILNKPQEERESSFQINDWKNIPYLNGGLFHPQDEDFFQKHPLEVMIPDKWFQGFFEFLELYNFTIDENTSIDQEMSVDPEMLGRIFENLLAEINPETGESARKSTGSFYTPREIVEYMVDESITQYLLTHTELSDEKIRALVSYDLEDDLTNPLDENERREIFEKILSMKIFDPACGSGAYPIGILQKILYILQMIDPAGVFWMEKKLSEIIDPMQRDIMRKAYEKKDINYLRKLTIIRDIIYGCDIQSIAVETSKLRCFLTLIVDEKIDRSFENFGIEPLPNLEFKFVCANTLIPLKINTIDKINNDLIFGKRKKMLQSEIQLGLSIQSDTMDRILDLRREYFSAHHARKQVIREQISKEQDSLLHSYIQSSLGGNISSEYGTELMKVIGWKMFDQSSADFFDLYWMYGIDDGFDIIIGNPPYVDIKQLDPNLVKFLFKNFSTAENRINLYSIFIQRSFELLNQTGCLSFINPNSLLLNSSYKKTRILIFDYVTQLVKLPDQIFENATVETMLLFLSKIPQEKVKIKYFKHNEILSLPTVLELRDKNYWRNDPDRKFNLFVTDRQLQLLEKIDLQTNNNFEYYYDFCLGITPYDKYKGHSVDTIESRAFHAPYRKDNSFVPLIDGSNIKQYKIDSEIKEWLSYGDHLGAPRQKKFFNGPKVIIRQIVSGNPLRIYAGYTEEELYFTQIGFSMINKDTNFLDLRYGLAFLNSKLINFYHKFRFLDIEKNTFQKILIENAKRLPIIYPSKDVYDLVIKNIDRILIGDPDTDFLIKNIDSIIYKVYNLTPEEIAIVEGNI